MNNQLSHEALTIYLRNLRTLEFIKHQCEESIKKINQKSSYLENNLQSAKNSSPRAVSQNPSFPTGELMSFIISSIIAGVAIWCVGAFIFWVALFLQICDVTTFDTILKISKIVIFIIVLIIIIIHIVNTINDYNSKKIAYENDQRRFMNEKRNISNNISYYENKLYQFRPEAQRRLDMLNTYLRQIDNMRQRAYSLNIIPQQFRGIYGVTYLYDFISTSDLSLSDAVLNCNLEQIKHKLDAVISKCNDIIYEQQRTNANLREIQRQNNQILAEARNTSRNTALAAQYSEIAAENSAVALELQKKQLAYQEVDFWLNSI